MSKVNEVLQHITTDLTYVSQDDLNTDEDIINFQNGLLKVTATDVELMPHSAELMSTIQIPCEWKENDVDTPVFNAYMDTLTDGDDGIKKLLMEFISVCNTEYVTQMFQAIIEDREPPKVEKVIDGYSGFLFYDQNDMPLVAMHWQHRFNHMVGMYNDIYQIQMLNITAHVCRHIYCSNMAKLGMNPKTLQYLMGHSDISITMNVYTHIGFDDSEEELKRMEKFQKVQAEIEKKNEKPMLQKMFKAI